MWSEILNPPPIAIAAVTVFGLSAGGLHRLIFQVSSSLIGVLGHRAGFDCLYSLETFSRHRHFAQREFAHSSRAGCMIVNSGRITRSRAVSSRLPSRAPPERTTEVTLLPSADCTYCSNFKAAVIVSQLTVDRVYGRSGRQVSLLSWHAPESEISFQIISH